MPDAVQEQTDGSVSSFWMDGEPLLLQTSSYIREFGRQVGAQERLQDRMAQHAEKWRVWEERLHDNVRDQAIGEHVDRIGNLWIHAYLVWPHLTVYATVSGPPEQAGKQQGS